MHDQCARRVRRPTVAVAVANAIGAHVDDVARHLVVAAELESLAAAAAHAAARRMFSFAALVVALRDRTADADEFADGSAPCASR
jgi:hypothetical protein